MDSELGEFVDIEAGKSFVRADEVVAVLGEQFGCRVLLRNGDDVVGAKSSAEVVEAVQRALAAQVGEWP